MRLGMTLAEYEARVGPLNKQFHETAEHVLLHRDGMDPTLPLDPDEREGTDDVPSGGSQKTIRRTPRG